MLLSSLQFVAHPHCQQVLEQMWFSGLPYWVRNSSVYSLLMAIYVLLWILLWPFACLAFMLKVRFTKYYFFNIITKFNVLYQNHPTASRYTATLVFYSAFSYIYVFKHNIILRSKIYCHHHVAISAHGMASMIKI